MRIAIATDQEYVASHFGCAPAFTIAEIENAKIRKTLILPNPGCRHEYWGDLFCRNSIKALLTGNIGDHAIAVLHGCGIEVFSGVTGRVEDAVRKYLAGELRAEPSADRTHRAGVPCGRIV